MCIYIYIYVKYFCVYKHESLCENQKYDNILIYTGFDFPTGIAVKYDTIEWPVSKQSAKLESIMHN